MILEGKKAAFLGDSIMESFEGERASGGDLCGRDRRNQVHKAVDPQ